MAAVVVDRVGVAMAVTDRLLRRVLESDVDLTREAASAEVLSIRGGGVAPVSSKCRRLGGRRPWWGSSRSSRCCEIPACPMCL